MDSDQRKEQKRIAAETYRKNNPEKVRQRNKEQYQKNRQERASYARSYYEKNKDRIKELGRQKYEQNKELHSKKHKEFRKQNPDIVKERDKGYYFKKKYGITTHQLADMWTSQNGKCGNPGCLSTLVRGKAGFAVDHCHETGRVRGLLCMKCNVSLGNVKDSVSRLLGLIKYLKHHANRPTPH
jgi:hypothetical protein